MAGRLKREAERAEAGGRKLPFSLRHPRWVLGAALVVICVLGAIGLHVEHSLTPTSLDVSGTESSRAELELHRYFGDSAPFAIYLHGPAAQLERAGPGTGPGAAGRSRRLRGHHDLAVGQGTGLPSSTRPRTAP